MLWVVWPSFQNTKIFSISAIKLFHFLSYHSCVHWSWHLNFPSKLCIHKLANWCNRPSFFSIISPFSITSLLIISNLKYHVTLPFIWTAISHCTVINWSSFNITVSQGTDFPGGSDSKAVKPTMQETWVQSLGWEDLLEKEMAIHSSCLESHGGRAWYMSMGSQKVGHDWVTFHHSPFTSGNRRPAWRERLGNGQSQGKSEHTQYLLIKFTISYECNSWYPKTITI